MRGGRVLGRVLAGMGGGWEGVTCSHHALLELILHLGGKAREEIHSIIFFWVAAWVSTSFTPAEKYRKLSAPSSDHLCVLSLSHRTSYP